MAIVIQKIMELKELIVLGAEGKQRLAVITTARSSRVSNKRYGQAAASSGTRDCLLSPSAQCFDLLQEATHSRDHEAFTIARRFRVELYLDEVVEYKEPT